MKKPHNPVYMNSVNSLLAWSVFLCSLPVEPVDSGVGSELGLDMSTEEIEYGYEWVSVTLNSKHASVRVTFRFAVAN